MGNRWGLIVAGVMLLMALTLPMALAAPVGPDSLNVLNSNRGGERSGGGSNEALAGNVTEMNITATTTTRFWQGYFGNVSGSVVLSDANNNSLYKWDLATPSGEIYATRNDSINWSNVACAEPSHIFGEDLWLGADSTADPDSVNRTFSSNTFSSFYTGTLNFTTGSCRSAAINETAGDKFYEVLQVDVFNASGVNQFNKTIYTGIISADTIGFDELSHDFQMMVSEPGEGSEAYPAGTTTLYYFWVELQ